MTIKAVTRKFLNRMVEYRERPKSMGVKCRVKDIRNRFGHWDLLLAPVAGSSMEWKDATRCRTVAEAWNDSASEHDEAADAGGAAPDPQ